jgi:glycosyltransferase involved in cell wall biosynthesis
MSFSVLMSVYINDKPEPFNAALESIWDLQILKPNQIVLVIDGPLTSELETIVDEWKSRLGSVLCIVKLPSNSGLASALNAGIRSCIFELVARMDADDISLPDRFVKQVRFMNANPHVTISSAYIEERSTDMAEILAVRRLPLNHAEILNYARRRCPINHPVAIYRKSFVLEAGGYPVIYPEDYPLWCHMISRKCIFANIPDVLLYMRAGDSMMARRGASFLKGYIETYLLMFRLGQIGCFDLAINIFIQSVVRLSPPFLRKLFYKYGRS